MSYHLLWECIMKRGISFWLKRIGLGLLFGIVLIAGSAHVYITYRVVDMPGESFTEAPATSEATLETASRLKNHVEVLANEIGGRSIYNTAALEKTKAWIADEFVKLDLQPKIQAYQVERGLIRSAIQRRNETIRDQGGTNFLPEYAGKQPVEILSNIWVEIRGTAFPDELLVVGAHYDTELPDFPGADDNSSGVAALLEIARRLQQDPPKLSVLLVAFTCEEYPVGGTEKMGSAVFAKWLLAGEQRRPAAMIAFDMLGYFSDAPDSQGYPTLFNLYYPDTADFIGFVGDDTSRDFIRSVVHRFRQIPATVPSEGITAPSWLVPDVLRSDHEYFVRNGIPGLMVTDTANFRYKDHYHQPTDTPEKLDYITFARVVEGLSTVIREFEN